MSRIAVARPRQRDQPFRALVEPLAPQLRAAAIRVASVGPRQPVDEAQVARSGLYEEQRAERLVALGIVREPDVAAEDRLDARAARRLVELDEAERIGEIGDRQRGHRVGHRRTDRLVDAHRAVGDRELAVQAQVDKGG